MFTNKGKPTDIPPPVPEIPAKRPVPGGRIMTSIIANGVRIRGALEADGAEVQVDGEVDGNIRGGALTIGDTGLVKGDIVAESVLVNGRVEGSIRARKVQLAKNADVRGDITHQSLSVEMGAVFEGQCRYVQDPLKQDMAIAPSGQIAPPSVVDPASDRVIGGVVVTGAP
jgi:cytoskeletal protein CcmA (bactofilin family)